MSYVSKYFNICRHKRQCKGGEKMVWIMVVPNGLIAHKIIESSDRSTDYIQLLKKTTVPICKLNYGNDVTSRRIIPSFIKR